MLDGRNGDAGGVADHGAQLGLADRLSRRRDPVVPVGDIGANEDDARVGRRRPDRDTHMGAGVHADAGEDGGAQHGVLQNR